ncbi:nuclear regulator Bacchus isoform X3 [Musca autumnalis]|uniref:nuclear regulator Bacchus isoform X3 n=1 Tax=Musca autumnalis TaxID=221902 RepID=UPI003CF59EC4
MRTARPISVNFFVSYSYFRGEGLYGRKFWKISLEKSENGKIENWVFAKNSESKKAKKDKPVDGDSDDEEVIDEEGNEGDSDIESDEYDIPYDGEEDDIECEDEDDENDDGSGSDDQA